jgi:23S rRNA (cytidine1920-2'-O)/16S rRNA (cytidine1409-2'-O)-methyltransferase
MSNKNHKASKLPANTLRYPMRLDQALVVRKLSYSRSRAEEYVRQGYVHVNGVSVNKPAFIVYEADSITTKVPEEYVSRAGLKLASVAKRLKLHFAGRTMLDVGSSTGGFTEYALRHGAAKVFAVDVGTDQLHPSLHGNPKIELHEKTDIRDFTPSTVPDIVVMDVSFISLRYILPHIADITNTHTDIVAMVKPQFEAGKHQVNKGVIKNDHIRRDILKEFEQWAQQLFIIVDKADSEVAGAKGNLERFYLLKKLSS